MRVVLDTNAIIYLNDFRAFEEIFTVSEVIGEVRDRISLMKLSGIELKIVEPSEVSMKEVKKVAKETGDADRLSVTDLKVIALGKEKSLVIISDDYAVQNVAEKMGIKHMSLFNKGIKTQVEWKNYCNNCRKFSDESDTCPVCGGALIRKRVTEKFINRKIN